MEQVSPVWPAWRSATRKLVPALGDRSGSAGVVALSIRAAEADRSQSRPSRQLSLLRPSCSRPSPLARTGWFRGCPATLAGRRLLCVGPTRDGHELLLPRPSDPCRCIVTVQALEQYGVCALCFFTPSLLRSPLKTLAFIPPLFPLAHLFDGFRQSLLYPSFQHCPPSFLAYTLAIFVTLI